MTYKAESLDPLITAYLNERVILLKEELLEKLVSMTNAENYRHIVEFMLAEPKTHELEVSMYMLDIATFKLPGLKKLIEKLLTEFKDTDALEDLQEAKSTAQICQS